MVGWAFKQRWRLEHHPLGGGIDISQNQDPADQQALDQMAPPHFPNTALLLEAQSQIFGWRLQINMWTSAVLTFAAPARSLCQCFSSLRGLLLAFSSCPRDSHCSGALLLPSLLSEAPSITFLPPPHLFQTCASSFPQLLTGHSSTCSALLFDLHFDLLPHPSGTLGPLHQSQAESSPPPPPKTIPSPKETRTFPPI